MMSTMQSEITEEWGIVCDDELTLLFDDDEEAARDEFARVQDVPDVYPNARLMHRWVSRWREVQ